MSHDRMRELCALALYGELDAEEQHALETHLASCADCASYAEELGTGLGRLLPTPAGADLPEGWRERLERGLQLERSGRRRPASLLLAAASFVAGAALAWSLAGRPEPGVDPTDRGGRVALPEGGAAPAGSSTFARAAPPPLARAPGTLAQLERYLSR
jgi:anti-sigma factor RsiW